MKTRHLRNCAPCAVAALLTACSNDLVVVLPPSDGGHIGGVVVENAGKTVILDTPYAAAKPASSSIGTDVSDPTEVNRIFASALAARPIPPRSYRLYFINDSEELVPASRLEFNKVFAEIARRKAAEIVITGYTDTFGAPKHNDQLSRERAITIRTQFSEEFQAHGIKDDSISTAGRGDRDPVKKTGPQVHEPLNRRVEITVR